MDLSFDGSAVFGGHRGKRYALKVEDGVVTEAIVEPDNTGLNGRLSCTGFDQSAHHYSFGGGQGPELK